MSTKQQQAAQLRKNKTSYNRIAKKLKAQILVALGKMIKVTFRDQWKAGGFMEDNPNWTLDLTDSCSRHENTPYIAAFARIKPTIREYGFKYDIDGGAMVETKAGRTRGEGKIAQTFRVRKDGTFNIDKIVDQLVKGIDRFHAENHIAAAKKNKADQKAIARRESEHIKLREVGSGPDNANVDRDVTSGAYTLTISDLNADQAKAILKMVQA